MKMVVLVFSVVFAQAVLALDLGDIADEMSRLATELFVRDADVDFDAGNYEVAREKYQMLAERGSPSAQHSLGMIYEEGRGVARNHSTARNWYRMAAGQNHAPSQLRLARMYLLGKDFPRDAVFAYAWLYVAAAQGDEAGRKYRDQLATSMSAQQLKLAQRLGRIWVRKYSN